MKNLKKLSTYIIYSALFGIFIATPVSASESITTNVSVEPSLTLSVSANTLNLNLDPSSVTFGYNDLDVTVGTNNATGYKLTMSTTSGNTNLINTEDNTKVIETLPTISGGYTDSTFIVNKWGYKKNRNTDNYNSFPLTETLLQNSTRTNADIANLRFATKIDYLQESGTYTTNIEFNLVANPPVGYLQNWTDCPTMEIDDTTTLIDSRDNEEYLVGKLADGNCWLLENLRLDISDPTVQANLTSATTNAPDETLGYLINGGGSSPYPANGVIAKTASSGSWVDSWNNPYIGTQYKDTVQPASGSIPAGKIGVYYNFCAASAGSYCYANGAGIGNANYDICPNGWRMPTSGTGGEYSNLLVAYNNNQANLIKALSTPLAGFFYAGSVRSRGTSSGFWASSRYNTANMYYLYINSNAAAQPGQSLARYYGFPIRCILK